MILTSSAICLNPGEFIEKCKAVPEQVDMVTLESVSWLLSRTETKHQYPALYPYVDAFGRKIEADRCKRDADHSIPRKVWNILMS